jgi:hypothetical protein
MNKPDLKEKTELELERVINLAHHEGLYYWDILTLLPKLTEKVMVLANTEYYLGLEQS